MSGFIDFETHIVSVGALVGALVLGLAVGSAVTGAAVGTSGEQQKPWTKRRRCGGGRCAEINVGPTAGTARASVGTGAVGRVKARRSTVGTPVGASVGADR
jgi:hypothetical protein